MTDTQNIKDRVDIVQLLSEYLPLKKSGVNWKANCPFHQEKSPSFMVHPPKQIWHCFGCGKGGDIFSFIEEIEGLEFIEALKLLANRAGVKIDAYKSEAEQSERNRLLDIMSKAAFFYNKILTDFSTAQKARDYLRQRGLTNETISAWQVGYIPDQWELLTNYFLKNGVGINDLVASGLTIKREGNDIRSGRGFYDRFRGRIMFPIADAHGRVVGFTGRVLVEKENSGGKYVNTPQSKIFDKSRLLYGLDKAKMEIKNKDLAVVVEGQMDVIASHQAGLTNVVAASGTALTMEQVKILKRYTTSVAMAFDADLAGENAGKRGVAAALAGGLTVKVIQIPVGFAKDADECIQKNPAVWFKSVNDSLEVIEWYFTLAKSKFDFNDPKQKQLAANMLLEQIILVPQTIEKEAWLKKLSQTLGVETSVVREEAKKLLKFRAKLINSEKHTNAPTSKTVSVNPFHAPLEQDQFFADAWGLVCKLPELYSDFRTNLTAEQFANTPFLALYSAAEKIYNKHGQLDLKELEHVLSTKGQNNLVSVLSMRPYLGLADMTKESASKELTSLTARIKQKWLKERRTQLQQQLYKAEEQGDSNTIKKLVRELQELN